MAGRLQGKIAVITGATTGMGLASARLFASEGATVAVVGRSGEEVNVAANIGGGAFSIHADVSSPEDMRRIFDEVDTRYGRLDILFSNAGLGLPPNALVADSEAAIDAYLHTNTRAVILGAKYAVPLMEKAGGGSIINNASSSGLRSQPYYSAYSASKGGVIAFTYSLARELGPQNIRVNAICPGPIETVMFEKYITDESRVMLQDRTALGRIGRSEEIATAALFLASEESSYITGVCLPVDGGYIC